MATIYDIAKICGLSPATVSKALSGAPDVSAATRARVRQAAVNIGYVPDGRARALSQNRSWTFCVLCQNGPEMGLRHYLFADIIESFKSAVERHGYDIFFISSHVGKAGFSYYGHCRYRKADGVFIVYTDYTSDDARELIRSDIPKIAFDYCDASIGCVMTDCGKSMELLYGHLHGLGHRNIVYMHGEPGMYITGMRIKSLKKAMASKGEALRSENLIESRYYSLQGGYDSMKKALGMRERPTAVIVSDDYSAVGAIRAARDMGLEVPGDISVVGFDGIELAQLMSPRLTTIRQDTAGLGAKAAESLIKQALGVGRYGKPENVILEPQLLTGDSCREIIYPAT
jgi:DNA-binding LacI/PurR family transcriptional regulator